jgi:hypothetical protein
MKKTSNLRQFYLLGVVVLLLLLLVTLPHSEVEQPTKLAFGILVHSEKSVKGAMELMEVLYPSNHCFYIHFDEATPTFMVELFKEKYPFVEVAKSYRVKWGKFTMVEAQLALLKLSNNCHFEKFVFLDGKTYPLKNLLEIELAFSNIPKDASMVYSNDPGYGTDIPTCVEGSEVYHACSRTPARCMNSDCSKYDITPNHAPLYKGPQWSVLSKGFIQYLFNQEVWRNNWIGFFNKTMIPDESFFQSLLMDSPYRDKRYLMEEDWLQTVWKNCKTYITPRSKIGYSPCTLGAKDYRPHLQHSKSIFVRKINPGDALKQLISLY